MGRTYRRASLPGGVDSRRSMLAALRQFLAGPTVALVATAAAIAFAVALAVVSANWQAQRAAYEDRIAELTRSAERAQNGLRAELTACRQDSEARLKAEAEYAARAANRPGARQLLEQQPEGIDACARMESADRAVLSNLKK